MKDPSQGRPTPWHAAEEGLKICHEVQPLIDLIANLTPTREKIRIGLCINGREISVVVPFHVASAFAKDLETLIAEKGEA